MVRINKNHQRIYIFLISRHEKLVYHLILSPLSRGAKHSHLNRFPISKAVADEGYSYLELYE